MQQMMQQGMEQAATTGGAGMGALATQSPEALAQSMQNMNVSPQQLGM